MTPARLLSAANAALVYVAAERAASGCCAGASQDDVDAAWSVMVAELREVIR